MRAESGGDNLCYQFHLELPRLKTKAKLCELK